MQDFPNHDKCGSRSSTQIQFEIVTKNDGNSQIVQIIELSFKF